MNRSGHADRQMLKDWANRIDARSEFPRLVRRLILETTPGVVHLGMPAGEGVSSSGWDGTVTSSVATAWVPEGESRWELSVEKSVGTKADKDFENRRPHASTDITYVASYLRPWVDRENWASKKHDEALWRSVTALALDEIDTWLEAAPATRAWFSESLGLSPFGLRTAETFWDTWSRQTDPVMSPAMVLAGRSDNAESLRNRVSVPGSVTSVSGPSHDEIHAFAAAVAKSLDDLGSGRLLATTILVDDRSTWRQLIQDPTRSLVLIPTDPTLASEVPSGCGHAVVVPTTRTGQADISISPIEPSLMAEAILDTDVSDVDTARAHARLARRSLTSLRRQLAVTPALHNPTWANAPVPRIVRSSLLAGSWSASSEADQDVVAALVGTSYEDADEGLVELSRSQDPLLETLDQVWTLVSAQDAWTQLSSSLTPNDVSRFAAATREVLGEVDPALVLPSDERWWRAAVESRLRRHSAHLRRGLAASLAMLGVHGRTVPVEGGSADSTAARLVYELLNAANSDASGDRWASISDVLSELAEAAPDVFLQEVRRGLEGTDPVLASVFADDGDPLFGGSSPHTHLLWALEKLAWLDDHLGAVAGILARLAELDPGGRLSNRPARSLEEIFCPWHPENAASDERRLAIIDGIRERHDDVAWLWMLALLPNPGGSHVATSSLDYREPAEESGPVTHSSYSAFISAVVERCIDGAADDGGRWVALLAKTDVLAPEDRRTILDALRDAAGTDQFSEADRKTLWTTVRGIPARHRTYREAQWALPAGELDAYDELAALLAPTDVGTLWAPVFNDYHPDLDDISWSDDHDAYDTRLAEIRREGISALLDEGGLSAVRTFAAAVTETWGVGVALADVGPELDTQLAKLLLAAEPKERELAQAYFVRRASTEGTDWLDSFVDRLDGDPLCQARALLSSPDHQVAWEKADALGKEVATHYWKEFRHFGLGTDFSHVAEVARRLMDVKRCAVALDFLSMYTRRDNDIERELRAELVAEALEELATSDVDDEIGYLRSHDFEQLVEVLEKSREHLGIDRVAQIELIWLRALGHQPRVPTLSLALAESPGLFADLVCAVYRPESSNQEADVHTSAEDAQRAENAYAVLSAWRTPPGVLDDVLDPDLLHEWLAEVRLLLEPSGRVEQALRHLGAVLTFAPQGGEQVKPPAPVRDLFEGMADTTLERGYFIQTLNSRGTTTRGLEDGGSQEADLATRYRADADAVADRWPRTSAILRSIASSYERDAEQINRNAERFKRGRD